MSDEIKIGAQVRYCAAEHEPIAADWHINHPQVSRGTSYNDVAWVTKVHDDGAIDIAWRTNGGASIHPDRLDQPHSTLHTREHVSRIAATRHIGGRIVRPELAQEMVQWERVA